MSAGKIEGTTKKEKVTVQQITDGVLKMIRRGDFPPGSPIREVEICQQFNVSRTPVREALRLLQNNGIVQYIPRCGVQVTELSEQELLYITETRTVLEVLSCREAASRITPEQIQKLRDINCRILEQKDVEEDYKRLELDREFHRIIAEASGNFCVKEYLENISMRQILFGVTLTVHVQRALSSYEEHEAIIRGLEQHDPELAAMQASVHFHMSQVSQQNRLRRYLEKK